MEESSDSETIEIIIRQMRWHFVEVQKSVVSAFLWASLRQFLVEVPRTLSTKKG
jgi:hypothetical protein